MECNVLFIWLFFLDSMVFNLLWHIISYCRLLLFLIKIFLIIYYMMNTFNNYRNNTHMDLTMEDTIFYVELISKQLLIQFRRIRLNRTN